ncbi:MAG: phosphopantetheine-binding protein [Hyphomicrobium sp.]
MTLTSDCLIAHIKETLHVSEDLNDESQLFSSGLLDSVAMLSVISFVEDKSGVQVRAEDVTLDNFDTVARILQFAKSEH